MRTESRAALGQRLALALLLAAAAFSLPRAAQASIEGRWIAEFDSPGDRVQLTTKRGSARHHSENSSSFPVAAFRGLARPASRTPAPARFELARDAGTIVFEGQLDSQGGAGRFSFAPNADFAREMERSGYSLSEEDLYTAAVHDIGRSFLKGLEEVGYSRLPFDDLVSMRIHGATPAFIRQMKELGYEHLTADDLVSMCIHGVSPEFVREMRAVGHDHLSADDLVSMKIHDVTPGFARTLKDLGYSDVSADDLVSMRIHDVTTDFVREIRDLGFRDASVDDLVSMRIHGVSAEFARRAKERDPSVTVDELVSQRIHGRN